MQAQTEIDLMFKQRIKVKTSTGIEFSGFNRDQSISSAQLRVLFEIRSRNEAKK
jgi:hypothetical protein